MEHPLAERAKELLTTIVGQDHGDHTSSIVPSGILDHKSTCKSIKMNPRKSLQQKS
jgi:hypothetical protein